MDNYLRAIDRTVNIWGKLMLRNSNIVAVGRGNKRVKGEMIKNKPTITVFVEKKLANSAIEKSQRIPRYIKGIQTDVYERKIDSKIDKLSDVRLISDLRPAFGGGGIAVKRGSLVHFSTLTYAFTNKNIRDKLYTLTASHTFTEGADPMPSGGIVYYVRGDDEKNIKKAWKLGIFNYVKRQWYLKNDIDAALIYVGENNLQNMKLISPGLLNGRIITGTRMLTQKDIDNKEKIYKIGFSTGYTEGEILTIKTIKRTYYGEDNISITDTDQIFTTVQGEAGDSGSLGIMKNGGKAFGMQNSGGGGDSCFSEIDKVLNAFNLELLI